MPQMSPMNWLILVTLSITSMMLISSILWNQPKLSTTTMKSNKKKNLNWQW